MSEDNKLLFFAAGLVAVGAVCVALLASCSAERGAATAADEAVATGAPAAESTPSRAMPASIPPAILEREPVVARTPIEPVRETVTAFEIEPGADLTARGLQTFNAREFDNAAAYFAAEVEQRPDRSWSHYMLALAQWKSGSHDEAAGTMRRAAELDEGSIKARVNLSRIENDRGEYLSALEAADAALAIDPQDPSALFLKGRSLRNLGRRGEALEALVESLAFDPDNGYVQNLYGLTLIEDGREEEAVEVLARATELKPEVAYIHNNLGMALERTGRIAEAVVEYRAAAELDAGHGRAAQNLARLEPAVPPPSPEPDEASVDVALTSTTEETDGTGSGVQRPAP